MNKLVLHSCTRFFNYDGTAIDISFCCKAPQTNEMANFVLRVKFAYRIDSLKVRRSVRWNKTKVFRHKKRF